MSVAKYLIHCGADVNIRSNDGLTAFDLATANGVCMFLHYRKLHVPNCKIALADTDKELLALMALLETITLQLYI
jgi:ankyrin repeat protein